MSDAPSGYRDYLDPFQRRPEGQEPTAGGQREAKDAGVPAPGTGAVWVNFDGERWWASWQSGTSAVDFHSVDESSAIQWARQQPAAERFRFDPQVNDYVAF